MSLATHTDANVHLDGKKISLQTEHEAEPFARSADRIVRGALYDLYPDEVELWQHDDPTNPTPGLVREIAALLMAHFKYASVYSEETQESNSYARFLYRRAMDLIDGLKNGSLELSDLPNAQEIGQPSFYPNDQTVDPETLEPIRMFSVTQEF